MNRNPIVWMYAANWEGTSAEALRRYTDDLSSPCAWDDATGKVWRTNTEAAPRYGDPFFIFGTEKWLGKGAAGAIARGTVVSCAVSDAKKAPRATQFEFTLNRTISRAWAKSPILGKEIMRLHKKAHSEGKNGWGQKASLWSFEGTFAQQLVSMLFEDAATSEKSLVRTLIGDGSALKLDKEGRRRLVMHCQLERSRTNRNLVLKHFRGHGGLRCMACDCSLEELFGPQFADLVEIHHRIPVSAGERVPKVEDFAILCPNCHRMAHWGRAEPRSLDELRNLVGKSRIHQASSAPSLYTLRHGSCNTDQS